MIHNFDEDNEGDRELLTALLHMDTHATRQLGVESLYATAIAFKDDVQPKHAQLAMVRLKRQMEDDCPTGSNFETGTNGVAIPCGSAKPRYDSATTRPSAMMPVGLRSWRSSCPVDDQRVSGHVARRVA